MHLKSNIDLVAFLMAVKNCRDDVLFTTDEGDILNLKSELSRYLFVSAVLHPELLDKGNIHCSNAADIGLIQDYLIIP